MFVQADIIQFPGRKKLSNHEKTWRTLKVCHQVKESGHKEL